MLTSETSRARLEVSVVAATLTASAPYLVFVTVCVIANWAFSFVTISLFTGGTPLLGVGFVAILGLIGARVTYRHVPPAVSIVLRITLSFSVLYIVASRMIVSEDLIGSAHDIGLIVNYGWIVAVLFGLMGLVRPSFGLFTLFYIFWQKQSVAALFGIVITPVDYMTIIDTAGLLILAAMLFRPFRQFREQFQAAADDSADSRPLSLMEAVFLAGIALHFGNYFYGALGKMALGDSPLYWMLENRTEYLILASLEVGANPLSFSADLAALTYEWFSFSSPLFNFATLIGQLVCVFMVVRPRLTMLTTVFFDLMHIGIFIFTGIFFWKFILLNLSIILGLRRMLNRKIPILFASYLVFLVVASPMFFNVSYFYWLDTRAMNSVKFWAVDDDGREYRVPSNYFQGLSVTILQQRLINSSQGPFPTWTWGTTRRLDEAVAAEDCVLSENSSTPENLYFVGEDNIKRFIQKYHAHASRMFGETGHFNYIVYPHHIFSVPWTFNEFRKLDKRQIVKYRYTIEAVCLGYDDGKFSRQVIWRDAFDIPIERE